MASLPPRSSAARRSQTSNSRETQESSSSTSSDRQDIFKEAEPLDSQASETVFPHTAPSSSTDIPAPSTTDKSPLSKDPDPTNANNAEAPVLANSSTNPSNPSEPRQCWICYADETEDTPMHSEWRSPCPCALTAHEACLLDWLADMENPKSPRRSRGGKPQMRCPQCQNEIVISRPRSLVANFVRLVERAAGRLVFPGVAFTLAGTVWAGCCAHGVSSMYLVFGRDETRRIFEVGSQHSAWNPRLNVGVPLIPLVLIFSRTRYAEGLLPAIPVLFFATHQPGGHELELDMWPPSAAVTFAALPYAKSFYSMLYEKLFGGLERKWLDEVQPRSESHNEDEQREQHPQQQDEQQEQQGQQQPPQQQQRQQQQQQEQVDRAAGDNGNRDADLEEEGQVLMEIELQVGMPHFHRDGDDLEGGQNGGQDQAGQQGGGDENQILGGRQENLLNGSSRLTDTVLGALVFPAISASMGGILKLALPRAWTTSQPTGATLHTTRSGLLHTKWGRSVVGGCLFVLIKDALLLYCRWKLAQSHRKRRVLNYDRSKGKVVEP